MTFRKLGIIEPILQALKAEGYQHPTPIQEQAIPILLCRKDLLDCAQSGTGKRQLLPFPSFNTLFPKGNREKSGENQPAKKPALNGYMPGKV
jgi:ATP-dependent RNA helicase RhlE